MNLEKLKKEELIKYAEGQEEKWKTYWANYYKYRLKVTRTIRKVKRQKVIGKTAQNYGLSATDYKMFTRYCRACGFNLLVELHHIDRNKKNNAWNNLTGLCPNCHGLIHRKHWTLEQVKERYKKTI